ncbi:MAG TPA: ferrous iron transporter B [bacterium]|nr:ferrous iron transporter B [bacterium]
MTPSRPAQPPAGRQTLIMLGNANVGKSVIFGWLTGTYAVVSNYPGTTVEIARGSVVRGGLTAELIDTPGINSLVPHSVDEMVTRDILLAHPEATVIQVADAKNLKRALLITAQLADLGRRVVLMLNMADEAHAAGLELNYPKLARRLGIPVIPTVATERRGLPRLLPALAQAAVPQFSVSYGRRLTGFTASLAACLPADEPARPLLAQMLISEGSGLDWWLAKRLTPEQRDHLDAARRALPRDAASLQFELTRQRLAALEPLLAEVLRTRAAIGADWLRRAGDLCQHRVWGFPILLAVLLLLYEFVGVFGAGICVDFIESRIFGETPMAYAARLQAAHAPAGLGTLPDAATVEAALLAHGLSAETIAAQELRPAWLGPFKGLNWYAGALCQQLGNTLLTGLMVGTFGLITVGVTYAIAIVLPIVTFFFLAFGFLEDSGYLPRLATMTNGFFRHMGLNGKAVLPMVLGLGCDSMATLTTRILYTPKERLIATLLLALVVPCSAQVGVMLGITAQAPPYVFWLYSVIIIMQLFIVGWLAARVVPGEVSDFLLEIPSFRWPRFGNILFKTLHRLVWFLKEAFPLFLLGTLLLWFLDLTGLLAQLIRAAEPVVAGMLGLPAETAQSFIMGFLRRDYGAAGLLALFNAGMLSPRQVLVALVTITLFIPCIANFFIIIREQGLRKALAIFAFSLLYALGAGAVVNLLTRSFIP